MNDGLVLSHIQKHFAGVKALVDGSLKAPHGEIHGLLGENGAGKSTMLKLLSGVVSRDAGEITLDGDSLAFRAPHEAARRGIATVFQESSLIPDLTVEENLLFSRMPLGPLGRVRARKLRRMFHETLERWEVRPFDPDAKLFELALDDRQLLQVVKAISTEPSVLILDEATAALTPSDADWVAHQARALADNGGVVLIVSHRMSEVCELADQVTVLRGGATVLGPVASDTPEEELITAMLGYRLAQLYPERQGKPTSETMVSLSNVSMGHTLGPVSLDVRRGEILGIFSLPGQGQRELLLALAGDRHFTGTIEVDGQSFLPGSPADAAKQGVVLVPEDRAVEALFLGHSTQMNVTVASIDRVRGSSRLLDLKKEHEFAVNSARQVGLAPNRLRDLISTLSGGNQQKAIFGRALLEEPKVLILFDSTRGVDVGTKAEIYQLVMALADEGMTVIFYSSDISETTHFCDRIAVISEGRIVATLDSSDASEEELLRLALAGADVPATAEGYAS
jgi:ribose transport system ATP-binding protein